MNAKTPLLIAALAALAAPAIADEAKDKTPATEASAPAGLTVFKDPKTGKLREAEPEESRSLSAKATKDRAARAKAQAKKSGRAASAAAPKLRQIDLGGAVGIELDDTFMSATIATVGPDGKVTMRHASSLANAGAESKTARPTEDRHDR
jgi:hypothetical protein